MLKDFASSRIRERAIAQSISNNETVLGSCVSCLEGGRWPVTRMRDRAELRAWQGTTRKN